MYAHLSQSTTVRPAAVIPGGGASVALNLNALNGSPGAIIAIKSTGRTAGSLTASLLWGLSAAAVTKALGSDLTQVITTGTWTYIVLSGGIPPFVTLVLTPGGGFDGVVSVFVRSGTFGAVAPV